MERGELSNQDGALQGPALCWPPPPPPPANSFTLPHFPHTLLEGPVSWRTSRHRLPEEIAGQGPRQPVEGKSE